jgi:hypothetical protein
MPTKRSPKPHAAWPACETWTSERVNDSSISAEGEFSMSPMARIRYDRREFWLMDVGGIESRGFAIFEITGSGVTKLVEASDGGC